MRATARRNRSEVVRHRRKDEATKRLQTSAVLSRHPVTPITARHGAGSVGITKNRPAVRRRKDAALSMPGIEVHMPTISFSGRAAMWRFVSFGLSLLLGAALYLAGTSPLFRAAAPQVTGNERIPAAEIEAVMASTSLQVFTLVPQDLEQRLRLSFPDLLDVEVGVWLPNAVTVEVHERKPVIVWNQSGGYTWIDETGVAFRPRGSAEGLVTVQAQNAPIPETAEPSDPLSPAPFISPELVAAVQVLAPHVPAGAAVMYDARHGLGWTDNRGWQVFFGEKARDMALKLRVYDSMVQMVSSKGIHPAFISVEYPEAPYYRMTQ
jgi:hypothetical protein